VRALEEQCLVALLRHLSRGVLHALEGATVARERHRLAAPAHREHDGIASRRNLEALDVEVNGRLEAIARRGDLRLPSTGPLHLQHSEIRPDRSDGRTTIPDRQVTHVTQINPVGFSFERDAGIRRGR